MKAKNQTETDFTIMKAPSLSEIKKELGALHPEHVLGLCMRLAKHKKDNKELLGYLLFHSHDEQLFIKKIKKEIDGLYAEMNRSNLYYMKKTIRKILKIINKYIHYSGSLQTEAELLIYFCLKLKHSDVPIDKSPVLTNLYRNQLRKINIALSGLHEDLQYDYRKEMEGL